MVARDIMSANVVTIDEDATVRDLADRLASLRYGALPVTDSRDEVVGVVSHYDLIRLALPEYLDDVDLSFLPPSAEFFSASGSEGLGGVKVKDVMRRDELRQVSPEEPVAEVARFMVTEGVRRVIVVEEGRLVGIISRRDVVRAIVHPRLGDGAPECR